MNNKRYLPIILLILISALFYAIPLNIIDVNQNVNDKPIGEIKNGSNVGQSFTSNEDKLCEIDVSLATYARTNTEEIIFHLKNQSGSGKDLVTIKINAKNVKDNSYYPFKFKPIENSKGKHYYFYLESPDSVPGNAITAWYSQNDKYEEGTAYLNHEKIDGDLKFRTLYEIHGSEILKNFHERILQDIPFFVFYLPSIFILLFLLYRTQRHEN
ncbi:Glycosyltransferase [Methanosarcina siciliae HI350]|uniref:Glycosyltransferase n=1 Tax=Methanosarcina siciliae HI350 TaxID=1434119 RepID=A0A0E3PGH8_9EURY|nr:hypothetical protein [Methanosarcina siciliae]AKB33544.1 Glycosyltransferase [Methanosarcina siciliae HI350]